jgi:hypothetical protein
MTGSLEIRAIISLFGREVSLLGPPAFPDSGIGNYLIRLVQAAETARDFSADRAPSQGRKTKIP